MNDVYGHGAGDQLLRMASDRTSRALGHAEFWGRVGGDEFVFLQSAGSQPESAAALATRLIEAFDPKFEIDGSLTDIGASIGIALCPDDGNTAEQILAMPTWRSTAPRARGAASLASSSPIWTWPPAVAGTLRKS